MIDINFSSLLEEYDENRMEKKLVINCLSIICTTYKLQHIYIAIYSFSAYW